MELHYLSESKCKSYMNREVIFLRALSADDAAVDPDRVALEQQADVVVFAVNRLLSLDPELQGAAVEPSQVIGGIGAVTPREDSGSQLGQMNCILGVVELVIGLAEERSVGGEPPEDELVNGAHRPLYRPVSEGLAELRNVLQLHLRHFRNSFLHDFILSLYIYLASKNEFQTQIYLRLPPTRSALTLPSARLMNAP